MSPEKKSRKSLMRIYQVFRRSISSNGEERADTRISNPRSCERDHAENLLFGVPLNRLIGNQIPKSVKGMLIQVFLKGPSTQGIFRKSANARLVRELREKLDRGKDIDLSHIPILTTAALLKEFLRSLPDPLLCAHLFPDWTSALASQDINEKIGRLKSVLDMLPTANSLLLQHFLCVLHHISARSRENLMSSVNLGVCVGPSLLWVPSLTPSSSRTVPALVTLLIDHCEALCGPHVVSLLGEPPERDATRLDSGSEESDSLHSGGGIRRDDSSIDSLERELLESSQTPRKDKMSLSRDSGLTLSDTQLYTPDEEDTSSTSGSDSGVGRVVHQRTSPNSYPVNSPFMSTPPSTGHYHTKVITSLSTPQPSPFGTLAEKGRLMVNMLPEPKKYVRVYAGWDERMECFRKGCASSVNAKPIPRLTQSQTGEPQVLKNLPRRQSHFPGPLSPCVSKQHSRRTPDSESESAAALRPRGAASPPPLPPRRGSAVAAPAECGPQAARRRGQSGERPGRRRERGAAQRSRSLPPGDKAGGSAPSPAPRANEVSRVRGLPGGAPPPYRHPPSYLPAPRTHPHPPCQSDRSIVLEEESYV